MNEKWVAGLRSVQFGVTDLQRSLAFYTKAWGLEQVSSDRDSLYLRARGREHHALQLTRSAVAGLMGIDFAAVDRAAVDALVERTRAEGSHGCSDAYEVSAAAGGGWQVDITGPEGLRVGVCAGAAVHATSRDTPATPSRLTHVVLNTAQIEAQRSFWLDFLGFRLSDSTQRMDFLRSGPDHHSLALAPGDGLSLNHAAFEMQDIDGQMYGSGRVVAQGFPLEWGLGRHGPGSNVFCYFIDPDGLAVEYTTEVEQVDDATHVAQTPAYWAAFPSRPCRWGVAMKPSDRLADAFAGQGLARAA